MSYSVQISSLPDPLYLGPVGAWDNFARWAEDLPEEFEKVRDLVTTGEATDTLILQAELLELQERVRLRLVPADTSGILDTLTEVLGEGDTDESITLVD